MIDWIKAHRTVTIHYVDRYPGDMTRYSDPKQCRLETLGNNGDVVLRHGNATYAMKIRAYKSCWEGSCHILRFLDSPSLGM